MKTDKQKLNELFRKHYPKTLEFYQTLGLSDKDQDTLINSHIKRQIKSVNMVLAREYFCTEPTQIELE